MNHDAQAATQAGEGVIHWKPDGELISNALLGNGLLIARRMLSPFQAHSLQVKEHARELGRMGRAPRHGHSNALVFTEPPTCRTGAIPLPWPLQQSGSFSTEGRRLTTQYEL